MSRKARPWFRRFDGWWYICMNGKQLRLAEGRKNKRAALERWHELELETAANPPIGDPEQTVASVIDAYLDHARHDLDAETHARRTRYLQFFAEAHGFRVVGDCLPIHLTQWLDSKTAWESDWTRATVIKIVQRAFNWAARQRFIQANPFVGITQRPGEPRRPMTDKEFHKVIRATVRGLPKGHKRRNPRRRPTAGTRFRNALFFLRYTGARPSEMASLTWDAVDFEHGVVVLTQHKTRKLLRSPRPRIIQIVSEVAKLLKRIRRQETFADSHVFLSSQGRTNNGGAPGTRWHGAVRPKHDKDRLFKFWKVVPPGTAGSSIDVPYEQMAFFNMPDPSDPIGTLSPLQTQAKAVETDEQIQAAQYHAMKNGIRPGVILKAGRLPDMHGGEGMRPVLTPDQREQLVTAIQLAYEGVTRWGYPAIVDGLIDDIVPYTTTPQEMDFVNSSALTKARIMQGFGVNPIVAGEVEGANRASAAVADDSFCHNVLNPLITLMSQVLTISLGPMFAGPGERLVIWIEAVRPRDEELALREWQAAGQFSVVTGDEFRAAVLNLPPLPDGQGEELISAGAAPGQKPQNPMSGEDGSEFDAGDQNASAGNQNQGGKPPKNPVPPNAKPGKNPKAGAGGKANPKKPSTGNSRTPDEAKAYMLVDRLPARIIKQVKAIAKSQRTAERAMARDLKRYFAGQHKEVTAALGATPLKGKSPAKIVDSIFDAESWTKLLKGVVRGHLLATASTGAASEIKSVRKQSKKAFSLSDELLKAINDLIEDSFDQDYWDDITDTTRERLVDAVRETVLEDGEDLDALTDAIGDVLGDDASESRAAAIARTETTGMLNGGRHAAMSELADEGLIAGKQWLALLDGNERESHADAHEQIVPVDEPFQVGDDEGMYPGDPDLSPEERVNCRCVCVSVLGGEEAGGAGESESDEDDDEGGEKIYSPPGRKFNDNHDPANGQFTSGPGGGAGGMAADKGGGSGGGAKKNSGNRTTAPKPYDRSAASKAVHVESNGEAQDYANRNALKVASKIGAQSTARDENGNTTHPMDAIMKGSGAMKGKEHGLEFKTLCIGKQDRLNNHVDARDRKEEWHDAKETRIVHTIGLDHRDKYTGEGATGKEAYSGHEIYYRRGSGAFTLNSMYKCKDAAELKRLINTPSDQLPKKAQPKPTRGTGFEWKATESEQQ